ncbi:hypothetical protein DPMN_050901 [Dreissena polymorpha]|uniref:Uncharacterized protein n=1 Tax=Dreissena polymorpha TaxID=45954 RepID=A0A9D4CHM4_DREPO|nr:hypothetical protein DPMN_050901 [Dreissena polymorpha]
MRENIGKAVTRYDMARIACKAYLKAMSPWNIVSAFKKTGVAPLNKHAISDVQLMPCGAFRDDTLVLKCRTIQSGKHAVETYQNRKLTVNATCSCPCNCQKKKSLPSIKKPNPSGKEITGDEFLEEMEVYASQKEYLPPSSVMSTTGTKKKKPTPVAHVASHISPKPSTSGIQQERMDLSESDEWSDVEDIQVCGVCKRFSPEGLID